MASLNAVGTALGKSGAVTLEDATLNRFTRTHAASGYKRVNPFEVQAGRAPSEETAPHSLNDWESYGHTTMAAGSDLAATVGYGEIDVSWTKPAGYDAGAACLTQRVYWKDMGTSEDINVNPFSAPTGSADGGDGSSYTITGLLAGHWYAIGVKAEFDDSVATHENSDGAAYANAAGETALIGGGIGISSGAAVFSDAPTIDGVVQLTDPDACTAGCTSCVDLRVDLTMEGPSLGTLQEQVDGGGFSTIATNVGAGSTSVTLTNRDAGKQYDYRIRYNDVSPDTWSNTGTLTTQCNLV